jgi:hypothetical protein
MALDIYFGEWIVLRDCLFERGLTGVFIGRFTYYYRCDRCLWLHFELSGYCIVALKRGAQFHSRASQGRQRQHQR